MENFYVHSVNKPQEVMVKTSYEDFHCEPLRQLIESNFSREEVNHLMISMETPNGALDVMQRSFDTIVRPIKRTLHEFISKTDKFEKEILASKGDISKIKRFSITVSILRLLTRDKNKNISRRAEQILRLHGNVAHMKSYFMRGYQTKGSLNGSFVWGTYVIYVTYIAAATSHLIAIHAGQMKKESFLLSQLDAQNKAFGDGTMKKWCEFFLKKKGEKEAVKEDFGIVVGVAAVGIILTVAFFLRVLVFYFYYSRMQLSDYFNQQSDYFNLHASEVKKSGLDSSQKEAVIKNQKVWADRFSKLSEFVVVDDLKAAKKSKDFVKASNNEVTPAKIDTPNVGMDFL